MSGTPGPRKPRTRNLANSGRSFMPGRVGGSSTRGIQRTPNSRPAIPGDVLHELAKKFLGEGVKTRAALARAIARHPNMVGFSEGAIGKALEQLGEKEQIELPKPTGRSGKRNPITPERLREIKAYADAHPELSEMQIAKNLEVGKRTLTRARAFK